MAQRGQDLYKRAKKLIPGGTQLLSKRPEHFLPEYWPSYYDHAKGVEVWDLDGKKYIDMSINGIGACILGAADPEVDRAVLQAIEKGSMSTLNCAEEVELAELLCELHPWADMVRYARTGGEAVAVAIRIARAYSGKDTIAFCGYHGWHDWYLSANLADDHALDGHLLPGLEPKGVPRCLKGTMLPFHYNHIKELHSLVEQHGKEIGAIIMEPIRDHEPEENFLHDVRSVADSLTIPLLFDEISAGFRLTCGGAHLLYEVTPDIAVFAKAISNGYPMAAIIGQREVMQAAQDTFISSTYWTERIGPTAALATIRKHRAQKVHEHLIHIGTLVQEGWQSAAEETGIEIDVGGIKPMSHFSFKTKSSDYCHTFYVQEMLKHSFLASASFYATYAHKEEHIEEYLKATVNVFKEIATALKTGTIEQKLKGPLAYSDFRRLT